MIGLEEKMHSKENLVAETGFKILAAVGIWPLFGKNWRWFLSRWYNPKPAMTFLSQFRMSQDERSVPGIMVGWEIDLCSSSTALCLMSEAVQLPTVWMRYCNVLQHPSSYASSCKGQARHMPQRQKSPTTAYQPITWRQKKTLSKQALL